MYNTIELVSNCSHMEKIGLNSDIPLQWFLRGFAGVLHGNALEKIWDKVGGAGNELAAHSVCPA